MSILSYNEIKQRAYIIHEDEPWEVIESQVSRKQANKPVNKTKIKNMISGRVVDHTFHVSDKVRKAELERKDITFLYLHEKKGEYWFSDPENPKDRFILEKDLVGDEIRFITEKSLVQAILFEKPGADDASIIGIKYPMKVDLKVAEAPPNIKGDTATGGRKVVTVETGANVNVPMFINAGDIIVVNTESGDYSERKEKA